MKEVKKTARSVQPEGRLHKAAEYGSPRARRVYTGLRKLSRAATDRKRRALAGGHVDERFAIDPDLGFRIFAPGEVPGADEVVTAANDLIERHGGRPEVKKGKHMRKRLLDPEELDPESPFMRFALSQPIISAATAYLGVVPLLSYGDVWWSGHVEGKLRNSQLYHCDSADMTQMKAFIHCNDVVEEAGPLTVVEAAESERVMNEIGYKFGDRAADEQVRNAIDPSTEHPIVGPKGTVAFVDTSRCFHFGSRVTDKSRTRVLAMFQYVTPTAFLLPRDLSAAAPFRHLADGHAERERLVLGAA